MPVSQRDRGVVGMTDSAPRVNARIAPQRLSTPLRSARLVLQQLAIAGFADAVRIFRTTIDEIPGHPIELLHDVGLARTATQRFVAILLDVHGIILRYTLRGHDANFESRAQEGELALNWLRIHTI
jgi:hypothetical protein